MQESAAVICRDLGYFGGYYRPLDEEVVDFVRPTWLSGIDCDGDEDSIADCTLSDFGVTAGCRSRQRIYCFSSGTQSSHTLI